VPAILFVHFVSLRKVKRNALVFANYEAMEHVFGRKILGKNYPILFARLLTLVLLILALTGVVIFYQGFAGNFDYVLAIDSSASMRAQDYAPDRLAAAKDAASAFVDMMPEGSKAGILSFSGTAFVREPLTDDRQVLKDSISSLGIELVGGTAIGEAIVSSSDVLIPAERDKAIVLITDGESNVGISVEDAIGYAKDAGVTIYAIGIGTDEGGLVANTSFYVGLDSEALKGMANATGGKYYRAMTKYELDAAYAEIATGSEKNIRLDLSSLLMLVAMVSFIVEMVLVNSKYRTIP
jgi:Ca-activated chloride channel family protein